MFDTLRIIGRRLRAVCPYRHLLRKYGLRCTNRDGKLPASDDGKRRLEPVPEDWFQNASVDVELFGNTLGTKFLRWSRISRSGVLRLFDYDGYGYVRSKATDQPRRGEKTDWKYDGSFASYRRKHSEVVTIRRANGGTKLRGQRRFKSKGTRSSHVIGPVFLRDFSKRARARFRGKVISTGFFDPICVVAHGHSDWPSIST